MLPVVLVADRLQVLINSTEY